MGPVTGEAKATQRRKARLHQGLEVLNTGKRRLELRPWVMSPFPPEHFRQHTRRVGDLPEEGSPTRLLHFRALHFDTGGAN